MTTTEQRPAAPAFLNLDAAWAVMRPVVEARRAVEATTIDGMTIDEWKEWEKLTGAGALMNLCRTIAQAAMPATFEFPVHVGFPDWFSTEDETFLLGFER